MALAKILRLNTRGISLMELLIASILLSLVIAVAASVYVTAGRFLGTVRTSMRTSQLPNLNAITRRISLGNLVTVTQGNSQLNIRCDCNLDLSLQTDGPGANDTWFHFRIIQGGQNTAVRFIADQDPNTAISLASNPPAEILYDNVVLGTSSFSLINPSAQGASTVVETTLVFVNPPSTLKTQTALGGATKR